MKDKPRFSETGARLQLGRMSVDKPEDHLPSRQRRADQEAELRARGSRPLRRLWRAVTRNRDRA